MAQHRPGQAPGFALQRMGHVAGASGPRQPAREWRRQLRDDFLYAVELRQRQQFAAAEAEGGRDKQIISLGRRQPVGEAVTQQPHQVHPVNDAADERAQRPEGVTLRGAGALGEPGEIPAIHRGVERKRFVTLLEDAPRLARDVGERRALQPAQQLGHVLGAQQVFRWQARERSHLDQLVANVIGVLAVQLAAQNGLEVSQLEAIGPVEKKIALIARQRPRQYRQLVEQHGDQSLLANARRFGGFAGLEALDAGALQQGGFLAKREPYQVLDLRGGKQARGQHRGAAMEVGVTRGGAHVSPVPGPAATPLPPESPPVRVPAPARASGRAVPRNAAPAPPPRAARAHRPSP